MRNLLLDVRDFIYYDLLNKPLPEAPKLDFKQDFVLHKERGGMWIESKQYPGLIASGDTPEELREAAFDAILTYFDVPRSTAKRIPDQLVLNLPNGKQIKPKLPTFTYLTIQLATN
ncbi:hypothetical protein AUK18_00295 [Candidatus Beckwithbacteria bacterium CG2_30_44_31]|uniref:Uncharacterized protein n=1 Tax=Candidatus Beckwithbacteria bacterium CG2_30_44_31 TaxID=1805035 RepID=A0A1J5B0P2_9BACT|nr:MAG: hypothetical protein AUK18_00295 [Candidatus Beckwithbacteria bacterium CG2_30_44_31]